MAKLPLPPPEVPAERTSRGSAPKFIAAIDEMMKALEGGLPELPFEWLRTAARQTYLHGFGRLYDEVPPRGKVTSATTVFYTHHGEWLGGGVDIVEKDKTPWNAPPSFWLELRNAALATGLLKSGYDWQKPDLPHVYWHTLPDSLYGAEGDRLRAIYHAVGGGVAGQLAVWEDQGMI